MAATVSPTLGLVLSGGGARSAYQAGVVRGIAEVARGLACPFRVLSGVSGGAINAMAVASGADDFHQATLRLWDTWASLKTESVFRNDAPTIARLGVRWIRDLALGGMLGGSRSTHLLDTAPLRRLLASRLDFAKIRDRVRDGTLHAVAVSATDYATGTAVAFFDGDRNIVAWTRTGRVGRRTVLGLSHAIASSAIPLFFPPEPLEGSFFGDGCLRLAAPLSPAIHLGADALLAIGTRYSRPVTPASPDAPARSLTQITAADLAGVFLNAVLLDALEGDLERLERINRSVALLSEADRAAHPDKLRLIHVLSIQPSVDLGTLAFEEFEQLSATLRYMLRGLGASHEKGWDLLSYLAFESAYTRRLLELGLADARRRASEIEGFLEAGRRQDRQQATAALDRPVRA